MSPIVLARLALLLLLPLAASANTAATRGEEVFRTSCNSCHAIACNKTGPKLGAVFGRKAGTVEGFSFSNELANSGIVWNEDTLDAFLSNPSAMVPGTRMASAAMLKNRKDRSDVIAWLKRQETSLDICL